MKNPTWTNVKEKLADFDRPALLGLVRDLYAADRQNRTFLHARFGLGQDALEPYQQTIARWLWPDVLRNQDTSVAKAKHAVESYKKAIGDPGGLAELMVFFCEQAAGFCHDLGNDDQKYLAALVRMFERALLTASTVPVGDRVALVERLVRVRDIGRNFGYGVGDDLDSLCAKYSRKAKPGPPSK